MPFVSLPPATCQSIVQWFATVQHPWCPWEQAGSQVDFKTVEERPIFLLVTHKLDEFAQEFFAIPSSPAFQVDTSTVEHLTAMQALHLTRLKVGLLLYHFATFDRRVRVPLTKHPGLPRSFQQRSLCHVSILGVLPGQHAPRNTCPQAHVVEVRLSYSRSVGLHDA